MKIAILTSVETRHRFFAREMVNAFEADVVAAAYEETGYSPAAVVDDSGLNDFEEEIVREHFAERSRQEERYFGHNADELGEAEGVAVRRLAPGDLNTTETLEFFLGARADLILVYGTNLVREPLLSAFKNRMINLHLGLSPYYRGTATNFYPLVNEEPEYVGATAHLITAGIDSGPILHQARPKITAVDEPHTIGCKAILAGIETVKRSVQEFRKGRIAPVPQWPVANPRLYLRSRFRRRHVVQLYEKLSAGLLPRYVRRKALAEASVRIVE